MKHLFAKIGLLAMLLLTAMMPLAAWAGDVTKDTTPQTCQADSGVWVSIGLNGSHCIDNSKNGGAIVAYATGIIQILGGLIGLVIVLMIIIGGIQYSLSNGDSKAVTSAKMRITNAVIALILYIMMFGIINYLIPGGIIQ
jgi:hypothetical protein